MNVNRRGMCNFQDLFLSDVGVFCFLSFLLCLFSQGWNMGMVEASQPQPHGQEPYFRTVALKVWLQGQEHQCMCVCVLSHFCSVQLCVTLWSIPTRLLCPWDSPLMIPNVFRNEMRCAASDSKERQFHRQSLREYELGPCHS